MTDLKEMIERMIHSYERDKNAAKEMAVKNQIKEECFGAFVLELKDILNKMNSKDE